MAADVGVLLLRLSVVGGLYLFLLFVVLAITRDLGRGGRAREPEVVVAPARLVAIPSPEGPDLGAREYELRSSPADIGRDPSCAVPVPDTFVSTRHALLTWQAKHRRWVIEDLGSTNGTRLNDRPVTRPTPVALNDVIEVGRVRLKLGRG